MGKKIKVLILLVVLSVSVFFLYKYVSTEKKTTEKEKIQITDKKEEIKKENDEASSKSTEIIWEQIVNELPQLQRTKMLSVKNEEGDIYLDMDRAFGTAFRAMGTAEEQEVIMKIVNTYLKELKGKRILITEEGGVLESGHRAYSEFLEE